MNNKVRTIVSLSVMIMLLFVIPLITEFIDDKVEKNNISYISSDLEIKNYDIVLDVDRDNKIDVTENMTVYIPDRNYHGIYRSIPLWQNYYIDNKKITKKIIISNLRAVGEKFELNEANDKIGIKVGSSRTNIEEGLHTYTIKYRYNVGKDDNPNIDKLLFNIFDNYDNTKLNTLSLTINMPKPFDNDITFFSGANDISDNINYKIDGNSLFASIDNIKLDQSLTIYMELEDGYFIGGTNNYGYLCLIILVFIILVSIGSFIAWKRYGKNFDKRVPTVEFYPPDNLDAAQIGYIYGEKSVRKLVTALLVGLASKGYIKINKLDNNQYELVNISNKDKALNKLSISEHILYQDLFNNQNKVLLNKVSFGVILKKINSCLRKTIDRKVNDEHAKRITNKIFILLVISIVIWLISYLYIKDLNPKYNVLYLLSFLAIFITGFFSIFMERRTSYGETILARVLGFRDYLCTAEKDTLDAQVSNNPSYFYDILPYTYVLNVSNKWISQLEKNGISNISSEILSLSDEDLFIIITE